jgi:hypothetical protein
MSGFYRFTRLRTGDPRCRGFDRLIGHFKDHPRFNELKYYVPENWDEMQCVGVEKIDKPSARYEILREHDTSYYKDGPISAFRNKTMVRDRETGDVLAAVTEYRVFHRDFRGSTDCPAQAIDRQLPIEKVLLPN